MSQIKWQVFLWIINPNLVNLEQTMYLYGLNETDLFMICQLYIMQHELEVPILSEKEVKSFILVNYRMKNLTNVVSDGSKVAKELKKFE